MKLISLILAAFSMLGAFVYSHTPLFKISAQTFADVSYGDSEAERMDVYIPDSALERGEAACILFIHGGSWSGGDKADGDIFCKPMAALGYVCATVNYTLYNDENKSTLTVWDMLDEIDAALGQLSEYCAERSIRLTAAATMGYSAGAHLAMLYSYSRAQAAPIPILFTAPMVGPADMSTQIWGETGINIAEMLTATEITDDMIEDGRAEQLIREISPVSYVGEGSVPTLIAYGGEDELVSHENGDSLASALEVAEVPYDYILFPNSGHSLSSDPIPFARYFATLRQYAKAYFGY